MSFASGSVSWRRFFIHGQHPQKLTDRWLEGLAENAFGKQAQANPDGVEYGWIVPEHLFDADFADPHRITFGPFVHVALRVDRTAPPSAVVKSYRRQEEVSALDEAGKEFLSSSERKLAREAADRRAEMEARKGLYRRINAYPVLMDLENGVVYLGTHGKSVADRLLTLFRDSFDRSLVAADAAETAARIATKQGNPRSYDDASVAAFTDPPDTGEVAGNGLMGRDRSHLGWEFLTWLWYMVDEHEGVVRTANRSTITLALEKMMDLRCCFNVTGSDVVRADAPARAPEARAARGIGKVPWKLRLLIGAPAGEWALTLDGPNLAVSSLLVPPAEEEDPTAILEYRFLQTRAAQDTLDALYDAFLRVRLGADWPREHNAMRAWAKGSHADTPPMKLVNA